MARTPSDEGDSGENVLKINQKLLADIGLSLYDPETMRRHEHNIFNWPGSIPSDTHGRVYATASRFPPARAFQLDPHLDWKCSARDSDRRATVEVFREQISLGRGKTQHGKVMALG